MAKIPIHFFVEDISFNLKNKTRIRAWINQAIEAEGFQLEELNYIFCSDEYLLRMNRDFLQHDYYTDVITFDNAEALKTITGDIFISIDRIRDNAVQNKVNTSNELQRVMIHGALHLLGYQDKSKQDKSLMTTKEDYYLSQYDFQL